MNVDQLKKKLLESLSISGSTKAEIYHPLSSTQKCAYYISIFSILRTSPGLKEIIIGWRIEPPLYRNRSILP